MVKCAQRIVKQVNISIRVKSSRKADSCLLSAAQIDASVSYESIDAILKRVDVLIKAADANDRIELNLFKRLSKQNVLSDCLRQNERLLLDISHFASPLHHPAVD